MLIIAVVIAALAALIHIYIFVLETLRWEAPRTRAIFGVTAEQAAITKSLAANQGVYNLMLAIVTIIGICLVFALSPAGFALLFAGTGSMLIAALYLVATDRTKLKAAAMQGTIPLLAIVATAIAAVLG